MDRESKKRARGEQLQQLRRAATGMAAGAAGPVVSEAFLQASEKEGEMRRKKKKRGGGDISKEEKVKKCDFRGGEGVERPPPGVFEFPWQEGGRFLTPELNDSDMRDVFFSSLVDGCSASIGFPGDRLSPVASRGSTCLPEIEALWPSEAEADGMDCIWSSVLCQPLAAAAMLHGKF